MLSLLGLRTLRAAATLAAIVPNARLRVRDGDRTLLHVQRPPFADGELPVMPPCLFRAAVADAYAKVRAGGRVCLRDLGDGHEPSIDVTLAQGDALLPGGIYRVASGDRWTHLFTTGLVGDAVHEAVRLEHEVLRSPTPIELALHHDDATEITVVHTTCRAGDVWAATADRELLETAVVRCSAAELIAELARTPEGSR